jgi:hypothetical protein
MVGGEDYYAGNEGKGRTEGQSYISDYNLQVYVPVPVAGAAPVKAMVNRQDLDVSVVWKDAAGKDITESLTVFAEGEVYGADITLTAKDGYGFDPKLRFQYPAGTVESQPEDTAATDTRILSGVIYKAAGGVVAISGEDLGLYIPRPAAGERPVVSFTAPAYTGTVEWAETGFDSMTSERFLADTGYQARVRLSAAAGRTFQGIPAQPAAGALVSGAFSHRQSAELYHGAGAGSSLEVFIVFVPIAGGNLEQTVADYDLERYVPVPAAGTVPVKAVNRADMDIAVVWKDAAGNNVTAALDVFEERAEYTAGITLTARDGYSFAADIPFTYPEGTVAGLAGENRDKKIRTLAVVYKAVEGPTLIEAVDLSNLLPAPVTGATPATSFFAETYSGTAVWSPEPDGLFRAATEYTAEVTLSAMQGYAFGASVSVSHDKATPNPATFKGEGGAVSGSLVFLETASSQKVLDYDLQHYVPVPAAGAVAVTSLTRLDLTVTVQWQDGDGKNIDAPNPFAQNRAYRAEITLSPRSPYSFDADTPFKYVTATVESLSPADNSGAGSRTLTVVYKAVEGPVLVTAVDLSNLLPAPVTGATPVPSFFAETQYTGMVEWFTDASCTTAHNGAFQGGTQYWAKAALTAASGWTFSGIPASPGAGAFTHSGATTVTHDAGNDGALVITIAFKPPTVENSDLDFVIGW